VFTVRALGTTVGIDVGDDDVPGAAMARDGGGHDADGARAGDQHVLAHQIEGGRGVHRIAQRIEDGRDLHGHVVGQRHGVEGGQPDVFGEGAGDVHPDALGLGVEMEAPGAHRAGLLAHHMALARHALADLHTGHVAADLLDHAAVFMAHHQRDRHVLARPVVILPDVDVGAADGGLVHADQHVVRPDLGAVDLLHPQAFLGLGFDQSFHGAAP
jgi:hypothetical protein